MKAPKGIHLKKKPSRFRVFTLFSIGCSLEISKKLTSVKVLDTKAESYLNDIPERS